MFTFSRRFLGDTTIIGFTGTIASGKTARCHRLVQDALNVQWLAGHGGTEVRTATEGRQPLSKAQALTLTSAVGPSAASGTDADSPAATVTPSLALPVAVKYVNADHVGHDIYLPGNPCYHDLVRHFGQGILEEQSTNGPPLINRRALGSVVFADKAKLHELNGICWPHISAAIAAHIQDAQTEAFARRKQRHLLLVLEAALLVEMGSTLPLCSYVWLTHCTPSVAVERVQARDRLSAEEALRRVASQADVTSKKAALATAGFREEKGNLELFDTSAVTLDEGLRLVDERFQTFWDQHMKQYVS